jgi:hypothetical protein
LSPRAGAFHLTLAQAGDERMLSVEFTAHALSADQVKQVRVHSNHLIHADTGRMSQIVTGSSGVRQRRGELLLGQTPQSDPQGRALGILWDAADPELPIYRTDPADSDVENTLRVPSSSSGLTRSSGLSTMGSTKQRASTCGIGWSL